MKFKIKKLDLKAGRPVIFIDEYIAEKLNVHLGDRVEVSKNNKKIIAVVDTVKSFLSKSQVALSQEVASYLKARPSQTVDITPAPSPKSASHILKKLKGESLTKSQIYKIISDVVSNSLTEAEIAYFISAVYEHGMSLQETIYLTEAMYKTGTSLSWSNKKVADKHSIGGIPGNRTTPIVVSICAAAGLIMPKTSSRAITSAAGTADVIETIAHINLSIEKLKSIVKKTNACLAWGGSLRLAPSDDKLIRVERLLNLDPESQLIASIMSKKLAAGSKYVLIDIPYGKGAKVSKAQALKLKEKFIKIGKHFKIKMQVVLTLGSQPIGNGIGPVLEIIDVLKVLKRDNPPKDLESKSIFLASQLLEMTGKAKKGKGKALALTILNSGKAYEKFNEIIIAQGKKSIALKPGRYKHNILSSKEGKIQHIDNKLINRLGRALGCPSDKAAGIYFHKKKSDKLKPREPIITLYAESKQKLKQGIKFYNKLHPIKI
ncbi:AMP phosphorylase [Candidatus Pacearchaeota archaeon]|nr:AMP phosphorylase [Candidatus Pacearchaeota archaeon]|tara:strand:+ start:4853 stop:6319 length:1467 start_codon:yes stop_codon:yes gene_type:complete